MGAAARVSHRTVKSSAQQAVDKANECVETVNGLNERLGKLGTAFDAQHFEFVKARVDLDRRIDAVAGQLQTAKTAFVSELRTGERFLEGAGFLGRMKWLVTGRL